MKDYLPKVLIGVILGSIVSTLIFVGKGFLDQNSGIDALDRIYLFPVAFVIGAAVAIAGTALSLKWIDKSRKVASIESGVIFGLSALGLFLEGIFKAGVYLLPAACASLGWIMLVYRSRRVTN